MRYLFLIYDDEQQWRALPASQRGDLEGECRTHDEMLRQNGHLLAVEDLRGNIPSSSVLVQIQDGQLSLTDGPLVPTQLSAFYIINARDLNEAIRVASTMPQVRLGPIEVMPLINR